MVIVSSSPSSRMIVSTSPRSLPSGRPVANCKVSPNPPVAPVSLSTVSGGSGSAETVTRSVSLSATTRQSISSAARAPNVKRAAVVSVGLEADSPVSAITDGSALHSGTTCPSIEKATSGRFGSLVRIVARCRKGPPPPFPFHSIRTVVELPGGTVRLLPSPEPGPEKSLTVHVQLVAPLVSTSGASPVLRMVNS